MSDAKTMPTHCHDIETLLPTYLDGELASHDHMSFEHHMADCEACRDRVLAEGAYQSRVRELLTPPQAPDHLAARVREALDRDDQQARSARRRFGRSWALPGASVLAAAAALVLFLTSHAPRGSGPDDDEGHPRVAATTGTDRLLHLPLSPSALGGQGSGPLTSWLPRRVEFDVQRSDAQTHTVLLQVMACRGIDLRADQHVRVTGGEVWVGRHGRLNTVTVDRGDGLCLVFTSDMEGDQLLSGVLRLGGSRP
jgi:anti-sigma factor RsiW